VLRRHSALPIADLRTLLRWVAFNYLIGNEDAHGKNLALLYTAEGLRLAPFYDLVSSTVYKGFSRNAAMGIGGERRYAYVERRHWERFAEAVRVRIAVVRSALDETSGALEAVLDDTTGQVTADAGDVPVLPTIQAGISERIERLVGEWA
jgi:serine/threonine-protein kinase HipA